MEEWLITLTKGASVIFDGMALVIVAFGAAQAFIRVIGLVVRPASTNFDQRNVWLQFARWLVAGLTFQLAADVVGTAIAPSWDEIGRLAAIAVIRTFLDYFLDRDVEGVRARQRPAAPPEAVA